MAERHLTREEEEREQQKLEFLNEEDATIASEKQYSNLTMLGIVFVGLALLIFAVSALKKGGDEEDEPQLFEEE